MLKFIFGTAFFVAINVIAAAVMFAIMSALLSVDPGATDSVWAGLLAGVFGVAASVLFAKSTIALIARWRGRARGRGRA